jgi:hypothetical protein
MTETVEMEIVGLSRRDRVNLLEHLPKELVQFRSASVKTGEFGDPTVLVAIICLTAVSMSGLFAWLSRQGTTVKASATIRIHGVESNLRLDLSPKLTKQTLETELARRGVKVS